MAVSVRSIIVNKPAENPYSKLRDAILLSQSTKQTSTTSHDAGAGKRPVPGTQEEEEEEEEEEAEEEEGEEEGEGEASSCVMEKAKRTKVWSDSDERFQTFSQKSDFGKTNGTCELVGSASTRRKGKMIKVEDKASSGSRLNSVPTSRADVAKSSRTKRSTERLQSVTADIFQKVKTEMISLESPKILEEEEEAPLATNLRSLSNLPREAKSKKGDRLIFEEDLDILDLFESLEKGLDSEMEIVKFENFKEKKITTTKLKSTRREAGKESSLVAGRESSLEAENASPREGFVPVSDVVVLDDEATESNKTFQPKRDSPEVVIKEETASAKTNLSSSQSEAKGSSSQYPHLMMPSNQRVSSVTRTGLIRCNVCLKCFGSFREARTHFDDQRKVEVQQQQQRNKSTRSETKSGKNSATFVALSPAPFPT